MRTEATSKPKPKPKRGRPSRHIKSSKAPAPTFEADYGATKKDLEHLADKIGIHMQDLATKLNLAALKLEIVSTMATKTELRILVALIMVVVTLIMVGLTVLSLLMKSAH